MQTSKFNHGESYPASRSALHSNRPSPEQSQSPAPSDDVEGSTVSLAQLLSHLLAAKQSLIATAHVHRAHEIIESARSAFAASFALSSRSSFLQTGLSHHLNSLSRIHASISRTSDDVASDFATLLHDLDNADERLRETLELLKATVVDPAFHSSSKIQSSPQGSMNHLDPSTQSKISRKTNLHDYLSPSTLSTLQSTLHTHIDAVQTLQSDFITDTLSTLEGTLHTLTGALPLSLSHTNSSPQAIASLLPALDGLASSLAISLSQLVRHYDLCVLALRHAEGESANHQSHSNLQPIAVSSSSPMHASTLGDPPVDPIIPSEYAHILTLIEADSSQLSSVLDEMATFRFEMEDHFSTITLHSTLTRRAHRATLSVFRALDHVVTSGILRAHLDAELAFRHRWEILRESLSEGMEELVGLGAVYNGFVAAYDAMCLELERRRGVESEIGYVMQEAEKRVESLRQGKSCLNYTSCLNSQQHM